jgi:hypothetical protein
MEATMPGKKYASIKKPRTYEALRRKGMSKRKAAKISNAQAAGTINHRKRKKR